MKTLKMMLLSAAMIFAAMPVVHAQQAKIITSDQDGWRKVAETTVDFEKDKDVLMVFGKDRFRKLQFMVMDAPIEITSMVIHYEGGTTDTINVGSRVEEGGRSRVIDLMGDKPEIGRITFNYNTSHENWNSSSVTSDKATRSASTRTTTNTNANQKTNTTDNTGNTNMNSGTTRNDNTGSYNQGTGTNSSTTTTTGTTNRTTTNDNTSTYGNSNTITGTDAKATPQNTNTSKAAGESKTNNSTKARVILWGLK